MSSSSSAPIWDVFLSFRGEDTRNSFTSHLYTALDLAAIRTYKDDPELEKGQEISPGLLEAIRNSKASIVVLSDNYAHSSWCLVELVHILACKKTKGLVIIPIFYHVNPSDIRRQKGSFGQALEKHKKRFSVDVLEEWTAALVEIANISGYHIEKDWNVNESDTIKQIVKAVTPLVSTKALDLEEDLLVGIDSAVEEIYEKLSMQSTDAVRAIGICGMGGIGKTTIAKAFHNKYRANFDSSCFVKNVKRTLQGPNNLLSLINQLLAQLLGMKEYSAIDVEFGIRKLNDIFSFKRVLVVLDDFDESSDLKMLIRRCNLFCPGSTIILTTRDQNLINVLKLDIYMVKKLGENESLELFSCHAFGTTIPFEDFRYLTKMFVEFVDGLPLALKVLGSSLHGRTMAFWKEKLEKVKKIPENKIHEVLKLSYDELSDRTVKDIFLDIVFFFIGKEKDEAVWVFESCGFFPNNGISILLERCLLIVENNKLEMHKLIQNMGWEVIQSQEPGKRKHLICQENAFLGKRKRYAFQMFNNQEGIDKIEGLILDLTSWTQRDLSPNIFEMMPKLRLLEIVNAPPDFKISFENSFQELRCIRWHRCPWTRLPSSFRPQKLVILDMQFSNLRILWKGSLPLVNLRSINVSWSKCLETIPNFAKVKRLEKLSLRCCENLLKLDKSLVQLSKLSHLELGECENLKQLPERIGQLDGLRNLDLGGCHVLKRLPDSITQLTWLSELYLRECFNLIQLPEEIGNMKGLKVLDASHTNIEQLPDSICQLSHLDDLSLIDCEKLRTLPEQIGMMKSLRYFSAGGSAISQLPDSFGDLINLSHLNLDECRNLERLPGLLGKMKCLKFLDASNTAIEEVPDSIAQLTGLQGLYLNGCKKFREIPGCIWSLTSLTEVKLDNRKSLESLPDSVKNMKSLGVLRVRCNIRSCLPIILCLTSLRDLTLRDTGDRESFSSSTKPLSLSNLSNLVWLKLEDCRSLGSCLPELPLNLERLDLERYESLEELPDLSSYLYLTNLCIRKCKRLQSLPLLPPPYLQTLEIHDCRRIRDTHDYITTTFKDLPDLAVYKCSNLIFNAQPSFYQVRAKCNFELSDEEILKWAGKQRSEHQVEFVVPQMFAPNNSLYMAMEVVYNCTTDVIFYITAVITRSNPHATDYYHTNFYSGRFGSLIINSRLTDKYSSGDRLTISLEVREDFEEQNLKNSNRRFKLEKYDVHIMSEESGSSDIEP